MLYNQFMGNPEFSNSDADTIRREYERDGFFKFENVLPRDEALDLGTELSALILSRGKNVQWEYNDNNPKEVAKSQVFDIHDVQDHEKSGNFKRLMHDARIMSRLSVLLGGPVIHHHDKGFVKPHATSETVGGKFPPHQDYPFFPHENYNMLAAIVYLSDIEEDMGPVRVFPGSHKQGPLKHNQVAGREFYLDTVDFPPENAVIVPGKAGTMVAFNLNTVHMSGPNTNTEHDRRSWLIQARGVGSHRISGELEPHEGEILWPNE